MLLPTHPCSSTCLRSQPFNKDRLHYSSPNLTARLPFIKFLRGKHHKCSAVLRGVGKELPANCLASTKSLGATWAVRKWFERHVSPIGRASRIWLKKPIKYQCLREKRLRRVGLSGLINRQYLEPHSSDTLKSFRTNGLSEPCLEDELCYTIKPTRAEMGIGELPIISS